MIKALQLPEDDTKPAIADAGKPTAPSFRLRIGNEGGIFLHSGESRSAI